jgi:hypothetical protein
MNKKFFKTVGLFLLAIWLALPIIGCGGKTFTQVVTGACSFLNPYMDQVNAAWAKIRADYPMYEAIVTGKTDAVASDVDKARAWIAAADEALGTLGKVINGVCRSVQVTDVQKALQINNETLPKTSLAPARLQMIKVKK